MKNYSSQIPSGDREGGRERTRIPSYVDASEVDAHGPGGAGSNGQEAIETAKVERQETKHHCWYRSKGDSKGRWGVSFSITQTQSPSNIYRCHLSCDKFVVRNFNYQLPLPNPKFHSNYPDNRQ